MRKSLIITRVLLLSLIVSIAFFCLYGKKLTRFFRFSNSYVPNETARHSLESYHNRFLEYGMKAEEWFADPKVVELCKRIEKKDLDAIKRLINEGVDINTAGRSNVTPLFWAMFTENPNFFRGFIKLGANPNTFASEPTPFGSDVSPLTYCCYVFSTRYLPRDEYIEILLDHGADPNLYNPARGETPVLVAAKWGNFQMLRRMVEHGADVNFIPDELNYRRSAVLLINENFVGNYIVKPNEEALQRQFEAILFFIENKCNICVQDSLGKNLAIDMMLCKESTHRPLTSEEEALYQKIMKALEEAGFDLKKEKNKIETFYQRHPGKHLRSIFNENCIDWINFEKEMAIYNDLKEIFGANLPLEKIKEFCRQERELRKSPTYNSPTYVKEYIRLRESFFGRPATVHEVSP